MKTFVFPALIAILSFGCQSVARKPSDFLTSKDTISVSNPSNVISENLKKSKSVRFVSRNGKMYGMDSDASIEFLPGKKAILTEFGYAPIDYSGTYSTTKDGTISLHLIKYPSNWPPMKIFSHKGSLYLLPTSGLDGLIMGGRGGAVETHDMNPFWPFKMISNKG